MKFTIKRSLRKGKKVVMDKKDFVKEHKNLLRVLRSKDHKDDLEEADEQEGELKEQLKKKKSKKKVKKN